MGNSEHASVVDINSLAVSMREQLIFYPLSQECCIYRVPEPKRCLNPSDYTPRLVSIGPLHNKNEGLQAMEEHKLRYLRHFLQRTQVSIEDFLALINRKEANLRNCYAETIKLESKDFVTTILVDAVFVLEFLLRGFRLDHFMSEDDRIFGKPRMYNEIVSDLWLVENQLPLFILNDLFNLAKSAMNTDHYEGLTFFEISFWFLKTALNFVPMEETLFGIHFSGAEHFLDLLSLCLNQKTADFKAQNMHSANQNMHSAKELQQAGVKFDVLSSKNLLHIIFDKGILQIRSLTVYDNSERFYRNVLAFENMHGYPGCFNDYVIVMSYLVNTVKDADVLVQKGVIGLGNSERLSSVFRSLVKDSTLSRNFQYSALVESLHDHWKRPCNRWKAMLKQKYFNSPWASISVAAAVIALLLAFISTACSIIALI